MEDKVAADIACCADVFGFAVVEVVAVSNLEDEQNYPAYCVSATLHEDCVRELPLWKMHRGIAGQV